MTDYCNQGIDITMITIWCCNQRTLSIGTFIDVFVIIVKSTAKIAETTGQRISFTSGTREWQVTVVQRTRVLD